MLRLSQTRNRLAQRVVKHDLSDPHTQENKHLNQKEVQGLEHMVVEDHGPKKGMAPQLKPHFNPLFFPFTTGLPNFSIPQDHDPKTECNETPIAHSQVSFMGRELNDNQDKPELSLQGSPTVNTMSTDLIQSKLTSPWPGQWQMEGLDNDTMDDEDLWSELEGTNAWNDMSNAEEPDPTNDTPYVTPWGLFREPQWITELNNAIEPEPEEEPFPLMLHHPNKDNKSKLEGELPPQTSNNIPDPKKTLSLQNNQRDEEIQDQRNPENKSQGSTSDDKEGTTDTSHHLTHQESTRPTLDNKEETTVTKLTPLETGILPWDKDIPTIYNATKGQEPHCIHQSSHFNMTQLRMT